MKVRECTVEDFPGVLAQLEQLWPDLELDPVKLAGVFSAYIETEADIPFCATSAGLIVGFASLNVRNSLWRSGRIAYLDILVVDEAHRHQGIGAALIDWAARAARDLGCEYVELDSAFHRSGAHEFYESLGFERSGIMFGKPL